MNYKEELGNKTWSFLHTFFRGIPEKISKRNEVLIKKFIKYLAKLYPCRECQQVFLNYIEEYDIDYSKKAQIIKYFIEFHNFINIKLNKPLFLN